MTTITLQVVLFNTQKNSSSYLHKVTATGRFDMIDWKLAHYILLLLYYTHYVRYLLILQILQRLDPKVNSCLKTRKIFKEPILFDQCSVDCKLIAVCVHFNLRTCTERIPKQIKSLNRISTIYLHLGFFSNLEPLQNTIFSKEIFWINWF